MSLRPNFGKGNMAELLRAGPYLDVEKVREAMVEEAKAAIISPRYMSAMSASRKTMLESFVSGEGHVLPDAFNLVHRLSIRMRELGGQNAMGDHNFDFAFDRYIRYFFHSDSSMGIYQ